MLYFFLFKIKISSLSLGSFQLLLLLALGVRPCIFIPRQIEVIILAELLAKHSFRFPDLQSFLNSADLDGFAER